MTLALRLEREGKEVVKPDGEVDGRVAAGTPLGRAPWCLGAEPKARRGGRTAVAVRASGRAPNQDKLRGRASMASRGLGEGGRAGSVRGSGCLGVLRRRCTGFFGCVICACVRVRVRVCVSRRVGEEEEMGAARRL